MTISGIRVLTVGKKWDLPFVCEHCETTASVLGRIALFRPDVIVSVGQVGPLFKYAFDVRKRHIIVDPKSDIKEVIRCIEYNYNDNLWGVHQNQSFNPLISVYTGSWNSGDYINEAFKSLLDQTYTNWEWVVVDDDSTDSVRLGGVSAMIRKDATFGFSSMTVKGTDLRFRTPSLGGIDASCIVHHKNLVNKYGYWNTGKDAIYANDWAFVKPIIEGGEPWVCSQSPTVSYNIETCGQKDFIDKLSKKAGGKDA